MKPKKRVMCPDCKRQKMLFETREQAMNFIRFNGDEIDTHGGVLRPYYCPACCGYHITSKEYNEKYDGRTIKLIKAYKKDKVKKKKILDVREKSDLKRERQTKFVNKVYEQYMADKTHSEINSFMEDIYPTLDNSEKSVVIRRIRHRQEVESLCWWKGLEQVDKHSISDKIAIEAVKLNVDELCVLTNWLKAEYKMFPICCVDLIRNKCLTIRDEMG